MSDKPIVEDSMISAAHPMHTGRHDLYEEAMRLVGAKHSKSALIDLVNWLLYERETACDAAVEPNDELLRRAARIRELEAERIVNFIPATGNAACAAQPMLETFAAVHGAGAPRPSAGVGHYKRRAAIPGAAKADCFICKTPTGLRLDDATDGWAPICSDACEDAFTARAGTASACRRCSECRGQNHHWLEHCDDPADVADAFVGYECKHCDVRAEMCGSCDGPNEPGHKCDADGSDGDHISSGCAGCNDDDARCIRDKCSACCFCKRVLVEPIPSAAGVESKGENRDDLADESRDHAEIPHFNPGQRVTVVDGISKGAKGTIVGPAAPSPVGGKMWTVEIDNLRQRIVREDFLQRFPPPTARSPTSDAPPKICPFCGCNTFEQHETFGGSKYWACLQCRERPGDASSTLLQRATDRLLKSAKAVWANARATFNPDEHAVKTNLTRDLDYAIRAFEHESARCTSEARHTVEQCLERFEAHVTNRCGHANAQGCLDTLAEWLPRLRAALAPRTNEAKAQPGDPTVRHVVAWMRATYPQNKHAREWADEIERVFLNQTETPLVTKEATDK